MLPTLRFYADGQEHSFRDAVEGLAVEFGLTALERKEMLPLGNRKSLIIVLDGREPI